MVSACAWRMRVGLLVAVGCGLVSPDVRATVPTRMAAQGVLRGPAGLQSGLFRMTFRLYTDSGTAMWEETRELNVEGGVFNVSLGTTVPLDPQMFVDAGAVNLGIQLDGEDEMTPRMRLQTSPYAFDAHHAAVADDAVSAQSAQTLAGTPLSALQPRLSVSGPLVLSGATLSLTACPLGAVLKVTAGGWGCGVDDAPVYTAGAGLVVDGNRSFSIASGAVTGTMVEDATLTGADLAVDTVTARELAPNVSLLDAAQTYSAVRTFSARAAFTATPVGLAATNGIQAARVLLPAGANVVTLQPAANSVTQTLTLPATGGNAGDMLLTDGAGNLAFGRRATNQVTATANSVLSSTATAVPGLTIPGLSGTYLVMFSGVYVSTATITDITFDLLRGAAAVADAQRVVTTVSAQRRVVAFQTVVSALNNETLTVRAFHGGGAVTDVFLANGTLTVLQL